MTRKTHAFSQKAFSSRTPTWAQNMFRITFIVTKAFAVFMAGTNIIDENMKYEIMLGLTAIDGAVWGFSKMFGVTIEKE